MASRGMDKEGLIGALASAMGQGIYNPSKYEETRYDESTRTLYCQGYIISPTSIEEALMFFRDSKKKNEKLAETDTTIRNINLYYQVAIEAIQMMTKDGDQTSLPSGVKK